MRTSAQERIQDRIEELNKELIDTQSAQAKAAKTAKEYWDSNREKMESLPQGEELKAITEKGNELTYDLIAFDDQIHDIKEQIEALNNMLSKF